MKRNHDFQSIRSEGGLLPPDLLRRVLDPREKLPGTLPEDYGLPKGERLNEVITQSWNRMRKHWAEFRPVADALPETEQRINAANPEEKGLRGKMWFWNFLPPAELNDLLSLYHRVSHKVLRISETTGLEGEKLLTPEDHFKTLKNFNAAYEGQASMEEQLRLLLNRSLQEDPEMEAFLESLPWRVFSARSASGRTPGIFACYRFPPVVSPGKPHELGELRWHFLPDGSTQILTTIDEINRHIASERDTPRPLSRPLKYRRDRLKAIEAHIRSHDLKARKSITMAQVAGNQGDENRLKLVAWMDVVAPEESGSAVSVSTLE